MATNSSLSSRQPARCGTNQNSQHQNRPKSFNKIKHERFRIIFGQTLQALGRILIAKERPDWENCQS
ncbi:predicted protein [Brucella sp. 83/13]|nr:predicted protein [Brucella sp. 83/13]